MIDISDASYVKVRFIPPWEDWYAHAYIKEKDDECFFGLKGPYAIEYVSVNDKDGIRFCLERCRLTENELSIYIDCARYILQLNANIENIVESYKKRALEAEENVRYYENRTIPDEINKMITENQTLRSRVYELSNNIDNMKEELKRQREKKQKETQEQEMPSFVYLLKNSATDMIKIGKSDNPERRKRTLSSYEGSLETIALYEFPSSKKAYSFEKWMHNKFKKQRKVGEWFFLDEKDVETIDSLYWKRGN